MSSNGFFIPFRRNITKTYQSGKRTGVSKIGKLYYYEDQELRELRNYFVEHLLPHRPKEPLKGAVKLTSAWAYTTTVKRLLGQPKITKPDTDNLLKLLKDSMTECGFWEDDAQVAFEVTSKGYAEHAGVYVEYGEL